MPKTTYHRDITGQLYKRVGAKPGPKPLPKELKHKRIDLTLDPVAIERGRARAKEMGVGFSAYVENLIYTDSMCTESV